MQHCEAEILDKKILNLCMKNILSYIQKIYTSNTDLQQVQEIRIHFAGDEAEPEETALNILYDSVINLAGLLIREKKNHQDQEHFVSLDSIFNLLFQNGTHLKYQMFGNGSIPYPKDSTDESAEQWNGFKHELLEKLNELSADENGLNRILDLCEEKLVYIGAGGYNSLADCIKFSTCLCACIYKYLDQNHRIDTIQDICNSPDKFFHENSFLLFAYDISGIQKFIYTVSGKGALKSLRSRSFYLDMLLEHVLNSTLKELGLPISSIIYSGGGRAYLLLPNTEQTLNLLDSAMQNVNHWLLTSFDISLYMAYGCTECSANDLFNTSNAPSTSAYNEVFKKLSSKLSENKVTRYKPAEVKFLNSHTDTQHGRECRICSRSDWELDSDNVCTFCRDFISASNFLLDDKRLLVVTNKKLEQALPCLKMPSIYNVTDYLYFLNLDQISKLSPQSIIQIYHIGNKGPGKDFKAQTYAYQIDGEIATFEQLANASKGIKKIAVLRADVDNLGLAFMKGFDFPDAPRFNSLMLTAALSRQLSLFFKRYIGEILTGSLNGIDSFSLYQGQGDQKKKAVVVYSGGDDMFIVGAWNDVIATAVDLKNCFEKYTAGSLTFSAGVGLFDEKYPLYAMAEETEKLEDFAKSMDEQKNAIALFGTEIVRDNDDHHCTTAVHCYKWNDFIEKVAGEKLHLLQNYFSQSNQLQSANGNAFLYRLYSYISETQKKPTDKINIAHFAYLLARLAPLDHNPQIQDLYSQFSAKMYAWILNATDRQQLLTAIMVFVYLQRGVNDK